MNKKAHEISMRQILAYTRLGSGVKSSAAQPRQTGRYCSCCKGPLPPHTLGTRYCILCHPGAKLHTVYVSFVHRSGWQCRFFEWSVTHPGFSHKNNPKQRRRVATRVPGFRLGVRTTYPSPVRAIGTWLVDPVSGP